MTQPKALITGITGQDGAYLAALLLGKGYQVTGTTRNLIDSNLWRLRELDLCGQLQVVPLDLRDEARLRQVLQEVRPDEFYNLGAQSLVGPALEDPLYTADVDGLGVARILQELKRSLPSCRFCQASSSELFGNALRAPQDEETEFRPRNPYGCAKLYAHWMTVNYRKLYGLYTSSALLYNHESPLRGAGFVTRKISMGLARLRAGSPEPLRLGPLSSRRDWGYAPDYVKGMWLSLQHAEPQDYLFATGKSHSIRDFVEVAASKLAYSVTWEADALQEVGRDAVSGQLLVVAEKSQPDSVVDLVGNSARARSELNWRPTREFSDWVGEMVAADLNRVAAAPAVTSD